VTKPVREKLGSGASSHLDTFIAAPRRLIFTKDASLYGQRREKSRTGVEPEAGMICSAKRIRSLYLPRMTGVTPGLSTTTPPQGHGLRLHYRWRDYAPLQSRPPCRSSLIARGSRFPRNPAGAGGRDGLRRKAHPEPLPASDDRSHPWAFHHNPAPRAWPPSPLSMARLCAFAKQTSLPLLTHRAWKPLPQRFSSPSLPLEDKYGRLRDIAAAFHG
jgi:hypothetical protein